MDTKTLLLPLFVAAFLAGAPFAQAGVTTTDAQSTGFSAADLALLNDMSEAMAKNTVKQQAGTGSDVINSSDQTFAKPLAQSEKDKNNTSGEKQKYVYKGWNETRLRHPIQDDRIDDGYVQNMMQRGPQ